MSKISFLALGGLNEYGNNLYILEIDSKIFVLDSGYMIPDNQELGTKYLIPKIDYLKINKDKIKGFFISHGHVEQFGALLHFYNSEFKNIPVYASKLTGYILEYYFDKFKIDKPKIKILNSDSKEKFGDVSVEILPLSSSIHDNFGFIFKTKEGNIIYMTDFVYDYLNDSKGMNLEKLNNLGKEKNLLVIADSFNSLNTGLTSPNNSIKKMLNNVDWDKIKRLVVGLYNDNLNNVIEILEYAKKVKKEVYIHGQSTLSILKFLKKNKYIDRDIVYPTELNDERNSKDDSIVILSHSIDRLFQSVDDAVTESNDSSSLRKTDLLLIPETIFSGTEKVVAKIIDNITKAGIMQYASSSERNSDIKKKLMSSPSQEDLRLYLNVLKPLNIIPVKGDYKRFLAFEKLANDNLNFKTNFNILVNGQKTELKNEKFVKETKLIKELGMVKVSALGNNNLVGDVIIDRTKLASDGCIVFGVAYNDKTKKIVSKVDLQLRGVVYIRKSKELIDMLMNEFIRELNSALETNTVGKFKTIIAGKLIKIVKTNTKKSPIIEINIVKV